MNRSFIIVSTVLILIALGCSSQESGSGSSQSQGTSLGKIAGDILGVGGVKGASEVQTGLSVAGKVGDLIDLESPAREEAIGQSVAIAITNRYKLSSNQALNDYVAKVGLTVASVCQTPEYDFVFGVLESDEVGAYSGPRGYIFITRGALMKMSDESELAGVLAHEVSHVARHHGIEAIKNSKRLDLAVTAAEGQNATLAAFGQVTDVAVDTVLKNGYSRGQEAQADTDACKYLIAAGYDPGGLVRFLQKIEPGQKSGGGMMSTHPGIAQRIARLNEQIASAGSPKGATLAARFSASVNSK